MKQSEIKIGVEYVILTSHKDEKLKQFHLTKATVISVINGKSDKSQFHCNRRGKKPNKYLMSNGAKVKANNLKHIL